MQAAELRQGFSETRISGLAKLFLNNLDLVTHLEQITKFEDIFVAYAYAAM
jgi:hypothetical protein